VPGQTQAAVFTARRISTLGALIRRGLNQREGATQAPGGVNGWPQWVVSAEGIGSRASPSGNCARRQLTADGNMEISGRDLR
jgi:hypothetical protein